MPKALADPGYAISHDDLPGYAVEGITTRHPVACEDVATDPRCAHPAVRGMKLPAKSLLFTPLVSKERIRGVGALGLAVRERRPIAVRDVLDDARLVLTEEVRQGMRVAPFRAVLVVPLLVDEQVIGTLLVGDAAGLVGAIRQTLDELGRDLGWSIEFRETLGDARVPPAVETGVFRIVQEALTNAARHARAAHVRVGLVRHDAAVHLEIVDDGTGFNAQDVGATGRARGLGLLSMRERAALLGGRCLVESDTGGGGTRVVVHVPLPDDHT